MIAQLASFLSIPNEEILPALDPKPPLPPGYFTSSVLDIFHYFNTNADICEPCRPHSDAGLVTVIPCTSVPGLQILDKSKAYAPDNERWIDVEKQASLVFCQLIIQD